MTTKTISKPALMLVLAYLPGLLFGRKEKRQDGSMAPPEVEVVAIEQRNVPVYREWVGTLEGEVNATISAQVSGYLITRNYREGSMVTNGEVLFQIEPAPFEATLAKAKAQLVEAQAHKGKTALDVKRYTPLAKESAISQQELDDAIQADEAAAGQVDSAKAAVQEAQLNLGFTTIRAPVDGVAGLASAQAQIGNLVGPGSGPLTTVSKIDSHAGVFLGVTAVDAGGATATAGSGGKAPHGRGTALGGDARVRYGLSGERPHSMKMIVGEFVLGRSSQWLSLSHFFRMPVPERQAEFVFGAAAEVMEMMGQLPSKLELLRSGTKDEAVPAAPETDEMAAAYQAGRGRTPVSTAETK